MDLFVPVIIGAVLTVIIITICTIVIVRKKKSSIKYDAEKAQGNSDESKKLNDQREEKIMANES